MRKYPMTNLRKMLKRSVLPTKFSYPKKPITLTLVVLAATTERLGGVIRRYTELTGIVPFDWEQNGQVPAVYQPRLKPGHRFCVLYFGFDTMREARAAKAKCGATNDCLSALIMTEAQERETVRRFLEQVESESDARPTITTDDGREIYWRDHPEFLGTGLR